jgi:sugar lactone lactonase YvrE
MSDGVTVLGRHDAAIMSPTFNTAGELFTISSSGDIYRWAGNMDYDDEFADEFWGRTPQGQPSGLEFDNQGVAFVCDPAHQAISRLARVDGDDGVPKQEIETYVKDYENAPFLGPNSLCLSRQTGMLYFTDSGPFGETSMSNPKGSVYAISPKTQLLTPLCSSTLAYPCGLALSPDEKNIYVCETAMNRILRFTQSPPGVYHFSVFYQLSGRFGPTAIAVNSAGDIFVAHFDFADNADNGRVLVISQEGEMVGVITVPGPEITGLCLTPDQKHVIITERSTMSMYRHAAYGC